MFPYIFSNVGTFVKSGVAGPIFSEPAKHFFFGIPWNPKGPCTKYQTPAISGSSLQIFFLLFLSPNIPTILFYKQIGRFHSALVLGRTANPLKLIFGKKLGFKFAHGIVEKKLEISKFKTHFYVPLHFFKRRDFVKCGVAGRIFAEPPQNFFWYTMGPFESHVPNIRPQ